MPEGPMILLYRERLEKLVGKTISEAHTKLQTLTPERLTDVQLTAVQSWGKYLFLVFGEKAFHLRIHWGMFGFYLLDKERPDKPPTATLFFEDGTILRLYNVSLRLADGLPDVQQYDPEADIMDETFSGKKALEKIQNLPEDTLICDVLMNQEICAGVGNAIKSEALFACGILPERRVADLPEKALEELLAETQQQSWLFAEERRHMTNEYGYPWTQIFRRKRCPQCGGMVTKAETGEDKRVSFWCPACQQ